MFKSTKILKTALVIILIPIFVGLIIWGIEHVIQTEVIEKEEVSVTFNSLYRYGVPYGFAYFNDPVTNDLNRVRTIATNFEAFRDPIQIAILNKSTRNVFSDNIELKVLDYSPLRCFISATF